MANKTNIGIGAVIALLAAAYFGIDLQHNKMEQSASPRISEVQLPAEAKA